MMKFPATRWWVSRSTSILVRGIRWAMFALLLYLILAVNVIVLLRIGFRLSPAWIMESAQLVAPWLAVLAASDAFARGAHPGMEFLLTKLPVPRQRGVRLLIQVLTLVILGLLGVVSWNYAQMGRAITITSMDYLTLFPFYMSLPVGFACMFVISLERTLRLFSSGDLGAHGVD